MLFMLCNRMAYQWEWMRMYCALIVGLDARWNDKGKIYNHRYSDGKNLNLYRNIYVRKFNA